MLTYMQQDTNLKKKVGPLAKKSTESKGVLTVSILKTIEKYSMEHNGVKIMLMTA